MCVCDRKLLLRTLVCVWLTNFCFHYGFYSYCLVLFCFYFLSEWINPKFRYFLIFFSTVCWYFSSRLGACCCISTCLICFHFQWMLSFFFFIFWSLPHCFLFSEKSFRSIIQIILLEQQFFASVFLFLCVWILCVFCVDWMNWEYLYVDVRLSYRIIRVWRFSYVYFMFMYNILYIE